ncbi:MAG: HNH endonuclease [Flavobacteriales bacterium]|nr:HNH endonuclease [Flavobacteriales bacterium]
MAKTPNVPWTHEHLLIALNLYDKIPFGKFDQSNPVLIQVAEAMGRTPGSVAMKLSNLASLDERLAARGIKGLTGASALDREVWADYREHSDARAVESEGLLSELLDPLSEMDWDVDPEQGMIRDVPHGPTERTANVKVRLGQSYFRSVVLNAYGGHCALTGLGVRSLLVASHIVPWVFPDLSVSRFEESLSLLTGKLGTGHRLDVRNGIALNALHDRAFDQGYITFDTDLRMVCGRHLRKRFREEEIARNFKAFEGKALRVPAESDGPGEAYLAWHRVRIFEEGTRGETGTCD